MYADRYTQPTRFHPAGLTAAVAINAALVAALIFAGPTILRGTPEHVLETRNIPLDPTPPPPIPDPKPLPATPSHPAEVVPAPIPIVPTASIPAFPVTAIEQPAIAGPTIGTDPGPAVEASPTPAPPLPLVAPSIDPRYASAFQPDYPAAERRANRDGRVTVRVLVGSDGRVKQIERVTATSDAFWLATQDRALKSWRFRPATRGNVPTEAWRTMTLTFRMEDG